MTSVANATLLVSTSFIFTALGYVLFLKGHIPRIGVLAIFIAFLGSAVIAYSSGGGGGNITGDLLALAGAAFFSGYMLFGRHHRDHMSTNVYTWFTYLACFLCLLLFDLATGTPLWGWTWRDWLSGLLLCLLCTFGGHSIINWSYKSLTPDYVAFVILLQPFFSGILGFLLLGEVTGALQRLGAALVIGGVLLYSRVDRMKNALCSFSRSASARICPRFLRPRFFTVSGCS